MSISPLRKTQIGGAVRYILPSNLRMRRTVLTYVVTPARLGKRCAATSAGLPRAGHCMTDLGCGNSMWERRLDSDRDLYIIHRNLVDTDIDRIALAPWGNDAICCCCEESARKRRESDTVHAICVWKESPAPACIYNIVETSACACMQPRLHQRDPNTCQS